MFKKIELEIKNALKNLDWNSALFFPLNVRTAYLAQTSWMYVLGRWVKNKYKKYFTRMQENHICFWSFCVFVFPLTYLSFGIKL